MDNTKIDRSIFSILSTISCDNLSHEQSLFILLHSAYVKSKLKFQIISSQYTPLTEIEIKAENYHQLLNNLLNIHNSTCNMKLISSVSTLEPVIKMSPKRFLLYVDKIINDDVEIIITFT